MNENIPEVPAEKTDIPEKPDKNKENFFKLIWKYKCLAAIVLLLLSNAIIYYWGEWQMKREKTRFEEQLKNQQTQTLDQSRVNTEELVSLFVKTFVWAVEPQISNNNTPMLQQYVAEAVQNSYIQDIVVSGSDDSILVSSDIQYKDKSMNLFFPFEFTEPTDFKVFKNKTHWYFVCPVYKDEQKIGLLAVSSLIP